MSRLKEQGWRAQDRLTVYKQWKRYVGARIKSSFGALMPNSQSWGMWEKSGSLIREALLQLDQPEDLESYFLLLPRLLVESDTVEKVDLKNAKPIETTPKSLKWVNACARNFMFVESFPRDKDDIINEISQSKAYSVLSGPDITEEHLNNLMMADRLGACLPQGDTPPKSLVAVHHELDQVVERLGLTWLDFSPLDAEDPRRCQDLLTCLTSLADTMEEMSGLRLGLGKIALNIGMDCAGSFGFSYSGEGYAMAALAPDCALPLKEVIAHEVFHGHDVLLGNKGVAPHLFSPGRYYSETYAKKDSEEILSRVWKKLVENLNTVSHPQPLVVDHLKDNFKDRWAVLGLDKSAVVKVQQLWEASTPPYDTLFKMTEKLFDNTPFKPLASTRSKMFAMECIMLRDSDLSSDSRPLWKIFSEDFDQVMNAIDPRPLHKLMGPDYFLHPTEIIARYFQVAFSSHTEVGAILLFTPSGDMKDSIAPLWSSYFAHPDVREAYKIVSDGLGFVEVATPLNGKDILQRRLSKCHPSATNLVLERTS